MVGYRGGEGLVANPGRSKLDRHDIMAAQWRVASDTGWARLAPDPGRDKIAADWRRATRLAADTERGRLDAHRVHFM